MLLPTTSTAPASNFRLQVNRLQLVGANRRGFSTADLTGGFSSNLEAYAKISLEETGQFAPNTIMGFGGKIQFPFSLPLVSRAALWGESVASPDEDSLSLFPKSIFRTALAMNAWTNSIQPTMLVGLTSCDGVARPLGGAGVTIATTNSMKLGAEVLYGYIGDQDVEGSISFSAKIISNIGVQASTGYLSSKSGRSWMVSLGFSFSTVEINFTPPTKKEENFEVPSFEDVQKSLEEKPPKKDQEQKENHQ